MSDTICGARTGALRTRLSKWFLAGCRHVRHHFKHTSEKKSFFTCEVISCREKRHLCYSDFNEDDTIKAMDLIIGKRACKCRCAGVV